MDRAREKKGRGDTDRERRTERERGTGLERKREKRGGGERQRETERQRDCIIIPCKKALLLLRCLWPLHSVETLALLLLSLNKEKESNKAKKDKKKTTVQTDTHWHHASFYPERLAQAREVYGCYGYRSSTFSSSFFLLLLWDSLLCEKTQSVYCALLECF